MSDWIVTVSRDCDRDTIDQVVVDAGGISSGKNDLPLGDEIGILVSATRQMAAEIAQSPHIKGVFPNSKQHPH